MPVNAREKMLVAVVDNDGTLRMKVAGEGGPPGACATRQRIATAYSVHEVRTVTFADATRVSKSLRTLSYITSSVCPSPHLPCHVSYTLRIRYVWFFLHALTYNLWFHRSRCQHLLAGRSSLPGYAALTAWRVLCIEIATSKSSMQLKPSRYVRCAATRCLCIEQALQLGSTTVGISTKEGVVLAVEKRVQSPLLVSSSIEKIMEIDRHLGCAMSGLIADARTMVDHARVTSQNHAFTYDERIKVESVTQAVCDLALRFGESVHDEDAMMSRPFGVALLIAGIDENGPQLYVLTALTTISASQTSSFHTDPSGTFVRYEAKAVGSGSEAAQSELQDKWHKVRAFLLFGLPLFDATLVQQMTLKEAHVLTLRVLKQVMEEKLDQHNVQLAQVRITPLHPPVPIFLLVLPPGHIGERLRDSG